RPFETPSERAFDKLKIKNPCCRANLYNPPRIPIGGYFLEETYVPGSYTMGEHGVNFGDTSVLEFLHTKAVDEDKKQILAMGIKPTYKRLISTSNIRYGKKFTPTLLELSSPLIETYINLSIKEQDNTIRAVWELFLGAMYIRGWKGPGYGYPIHGTGPKVPKKLQKLLIGFIPYIKDNNVASYPKLVSLRHELKDSGLPNIELYLKMIEGLEYQDFGGRLLDVIIHISPEYATLENINANDMIDYIAEYFNQCLDIVSSLIVDVANIDMSSQHMDAYFSYLDSSPGIANIMKQVQAINYYLGQPVRQNYSLTTLLTSDERTLNVSRIIALTTYYTILILTGKTIDNFDPKMITGDESGITFAELPVAFMEFKI
ncbi:MAG: hypothetical protein ACRCXT_19240, partial [Paraclostridium sp.]